MLQWIKCGCFVGGGSAFYPRSVTLKDAGTDDGRRDNNTLDLRAWYEMRKYEFGNV